ncbi:MAG: nitrite/sulfite reductase [Imperialibacter sp.]|uniref:nitrite/sulfite reductase n=1 Tax=Imperialibacter sp. TaxID=2038411 RepID=UPI0032ECA517
MQSFRSELEDINNPVIEKDIIDLADKISKFRNLQIDDDKFRSVRLARGVYGQRQPGVQMVRIKLPYGRITTKQLVHIANLSDEFASSTLHATTRQDIQIHYVSLDRTPELWAKLEKEKITLREACGNTVRNVTGSAKAGIDPNEPFDITPYAQATFEYFLRNPICQEMGRKFKISFSSSDEDSAFSFIHDIGFIAKVKQVNGKEVRGFKVVVGGGLGAQPMLAQVAYEFMEEDQIIPFAESLLRVFDRYGERARRQKARMKFLMAEIGLQGLLDLAKAEYPALKHKTYKIDTNSVQQPEPQPEGKVYQEVSIDNEARYQLWLQTNVFPQKQKGFFAIGLKTQLGNLSSDKARALAEVVREFAADELRITVTQGFILKFVREEALRGLYVALDKLGLANPGFESTADVAACPGTDTCNLGISSSYGIAVELERVMTEEFPDLVKNSDISIKISGCPNSCGQHGIAGIGFHGSSQKKDGLVLPALQVLLGGGVDADGNGRIANKVIKIPSKRGPEALRVLLADYDEHGNDGEYYKDYFARQGDRYFYTLLKPLTSLDDLSDSDFVDWGEEQNFKVETAVGECAGVIIDLVATLFYDSEEKLDWANEAFAEGRWADSLYHSYNVFVTSAKALLLSEDVKNNTQIAIIRDFDRIFVEKGEFSFPEGSFEAHITKISSNEPTEAFASTFKEEAATFIEKVKAVRTRQLITSN